jgi:hypothetical protein
MGVWSGWQPSLLPARHQEAVAQNEEREGDRDGVLESFHDLRLSVQYYMLLLFVDMDVHTDMDIHI